MCKNIQQYVYKCEIYQQIKMFKHKSFKILSFLSRSEFSF